MIMIKIKRTQSLIILMNLMSFLLIDISSLSSPSSGSSGSLEHQSHTIVALSTYCITLWEICGDLEPQKV